MEPDYHVGMLSKPTTLDGLRLVCFDMQQKIRQQEQLIITLQDEIKELRTKGEEDVIAYNQITDKITSTPLSSTPLSSPSPRAESKASEVVRVILPSKVNEEKPNATTKDQGRDW